MAFILVLLVAMLAFTLSMVFLVFGILFTCIGSLIVSVAVVRVGLLLRWAVSRHRDQPHARVVRIVGYYRLFGTRRFLPASRIASSDETKKPTTKVVSVNWGGLKRFLGWQGTTDELKRHKLD